MTESTQRKVHIGQKQISNECENTAESNPLAIFLFGKKIKLKQLTHINTEP